MSVLICLGCGRYTNTAVCDYLEHDDWKPRKCYARYREDNSMEKGYAYDEMFDSRLKRYVDEECLVESETER